MDRFSFDPLQSQIKACYTVFIVQIQVQSEFKMWVKSYGKAQAQRDELTAIFANITARRAGHQWALTDAGIIAAVDYAIETGETNYNAIFALVANGNADNSVKVN